MLHVFVVLGRFRMIAGSAAISRSAWGDSDATLHQIPVETFLRQDTWTWD